MAKKRCSVVCMVGCFGLVKVANVLECFKSFVVKCLLCCCAFFLPSKSGPASKTLNLAGVQKSAYGQSLFGMTAAVSFLGLFCDVNRL